MTTYKPLPECVTIKNSEIHGLGVFATSFIPKGAMIGKSHHRSLFASDGFIRTPLGGFINHNSESNLKKDGWFHKYVVATEDIKEGEELTLSYTMYEVEG